MKERSGKDSKVEFQSGKNKKTPLPKSRPKSVGKIYANPPRKPAMTEQKKAQNYTGKVYNPEPKASKSKKNLPLSGKQKRMDKGKSRLNPFITYGETKKKAPPLKFKSPSGKEGGSDALYRVPQLSRNKKKKLKT
jgi:hypothetical protein